jgi:hypothetical protein
VTAAASSLSRNRQGVSDLHRPHNVTNYLMLMDWADERRIEMQAEGRQYWVPTDWDFWQAMRDCWGDLLKR